MSSVDTSQLAGSGQQAASSPSTSGSGAFGSLIAGAANLVNGYLDRRWNEKQIDKQWKRNLEQWNRENAYNAPAAQMKRLKEAGLNPNLMYGEGAGSLAGAPSPQAGSASGRYLPQVDPLTASQIALNEAQARNIESKTETENQARQPTVENLYQVVEETKQRVNTFIEQLKGIKSDNSVKDVMDAYYQASFSYMLSKAKSEALLAQDQWITFMSGFLADKGLKEAETHYYDSLKRLTDSEKKQVDFMLQMSDDMWKIDKEYYRANAHNQYVVGYFTARNARQANEFWNENKNADWWMSHITESLNTLFRGVSAGAEAYSSFRSGKMNASQARQRANLRVQY